MRKIVAKQMRLVPAAIEHQRARELRAISAVVDELPEATRLVFAELRREGTLPERGRPGMSAEQVLRALILKQMNGFTYEALAFHLADSATYRAFCRIGISDVAPSKSTLQRNLKALSAPTMEAIHRQVVLLAQRRGIDDGLRVRADSTVVKAAIHAPTDSSLLWDCVQTLTRLLHRARDLVKVSFTDHRRRAKRRAVAIQSAATHAQRVPLYRDLLKVTEATVRMAEQTAEALLKLRRRQPIKVLAHQVRAKLLHHVEQARRVIEQARRRVLDGESVPAREKLVSIFEPHADVIVKDRRETLYGHKVFLTAGRSGLVLDLLLPRGNPADSSLAVTLIQRQIEAFGRPPQQVCFDGGFTSKANLKELKSLGVIDVAFSKGKGLDIEQMTRSRAIYRRLRRFRAGIEAIISWLKRSFGLDRCPWRSLSSFQVYVWAGVIAANLLLVARTP